MTKQRCGSRHCQALEYKRIHPSLLAYVVRSMGDAAPKTRNGDDDFRGKTSNGNTLPTTLPLGMMCDDLV